MIYEVKIVEAGETDYKIFYDLDEALYYVADNLDEGIEMTIRKMKEGDI